MLHLATITHNRIHYILLPFADHLDVNVFLRCGISDDRKVLYNFREKFPWVAEPSDPMSSVVTRDLLRQCDNLADALKWLHEGMHVASSPDPLFCAHMDLKPANILILGPTSEDMRVGRWMISDFGISVFRTQQKDQDTKFATPLDYYNQLTLQTRPKRAEGPYTAPEVCQNQNQQGVGRRSDVWSFGCLFSEVYLFALGRAKLVDDFRTMRKHNTGTDYFYRRTRLASLGAARAMTYEVRPWILNWLMDIPSRFPGNKNSWGTCCIQSIFKMLNPDPDHRPTSRDLRSLTWHVRQHFALAPGDPNCYCSMPLDDVPRPATEVPLPPPTPGNVYNSPDLDSGTAPHTVALPEERTRPSSAVRSHDPSIRSSQSSSHTIHSQSDLQSPSSRSATQTPPTLPSRSGSQTLAYRSEPQSPPILPARWSSQTETYRSDSQTPPMLPSRYGSLTQAYRLGEPVSPAPSVHSSLHSQLENVDSLGISPVVSSASTPAVVRTTTSNEETLLQGAHPRTISAPNVQSSRPSWASQTSQTGSSVHSQNHSQPGSSRNSQQSLPFSGPPVWAHGIQFPSHKALKLRPPTHWNLRVEKAGKRSREMIDISKKTINSIAMTPVGPRVACLTGSTIHLFALESGARETHELQPPVELPNSKEHKWKQVALAGPYLGVWGVANGKKKVIPLPFSECCRIQRSYRSIGCLQEHRDWERISRSSARRHCLS